MTHKEFQSAGQKPGLQVWRLVKMDPQPVPTAAHGTFFTGDAYIVLHTTKLLSHNIHMWFGSESSQDETGAAAIYAIQLDNALNGAPVQYRETQDYESNVFTGGVSSGFTHVVTNTSDVKRLLHIRGRRSIRAREVDLDWRSFNNNDCFVIDLGENIYQWCGSKSNYYERLKSTQVAIGIRDDERGGRPELHMFDEGSEPEEVIQVLGPKPDIPDGSQDCTCEPCAVKASKNTASLYKISDATGEMEVSLVSNTVPFKQDDLQLAECYILDNQADKKLFVWKGPCANKDERSSALNAAQKYMKDAKYPTQTQISILPAGAESTLFKQFFSDWKDKYDTVGPGQAYVLGTIAKVEQVPFDATSLHTNQAMAAQHGMVDDGSGGVKIWRVEGGDKVVVEKTTYGQFFGGDCYLILYSYKLGGKQQHIIYIWQGLKCSRTELTASAFLSVSLDDSMEGSPVQVRVTQGQEPAHLVSLFKEKPMMVLLGGTSREGGQSQPGSTRLFHIRCSSTGATRAVEVEPSAASLNTNDMFVLKTSGDLFMWRGLGSSEEELAACQIRRRLPGWKPQRADFWSSLGGKTDYQTSKSLQNIIKPPRLFGCSNKTGRLIAEELPENFTQLDLATDDIMLLDTWDQIFIWVGKDANDVEKKGAPKIATDYVASDPSGRRDVPITTMEQGSELPTFTGWFQAWDPKMWDAVLANFS
ncbi:Gelsolin [Merluccius polli]|uniref:Gelsolin n=1 Tax=Merluccius polli TaxID=89951 RepID=A0AA47M6Y1_MERPO|nr:Gelsolin [Merluccius polli]